jgi:multicomponent Na+:H+ antiporter subunit D
MPAITLNPGFVLIFAALAMLATPRGLRAPAMAGAAMLALWLLLDREFGAAAAVAQMGLAVVLLDLDALNRVFGIAFLIALVPIAIYASARRNRYEDAAILLLAGGAVSALFVGDLVSFVAAASLSGLSAVWVVFASPVAGANGAGVRLLVWHGLEGLLFLVGVAFHISAGAENSVFARMDIESVGGGFVFAALMIRIGAPLAHVWLKDSISHASSVGGVALSVFPAMLGVYALARLFPAEPHLAVIGAAMIVIGVAFASAEDELRRAAAYGLLAQIGVAVALIGVGSPLARSGAEAHAFTTILSFALLQMALGAIVNQAGACRASQMAGLGRAQPVSTAFMLLGGLAAAGAPGLASYVSLAVAREASGVWEFRYLWLLVMMCAGGLGVALALRPTLAAHVAAEKPLRFREAPFPMLLAAGLIGFFCLAIGLNPEWLYRLTPTELTFAPYTLSQLAPMAGLLGGAGVAYLSLRAIGLAPKEQEIHLRELDAFYRGPVTGAGRWVGVVLLRVFGAWQAALERLLDRAGRGADALTRACDRPYADQWAGAAHFVAVGAVLVVILLVRR